ncbi:MAG: hypothetical protein ACM3X6_14080 [Patescibacteria group bacterium]
MAAHLGGHRIRGAAAEDDALLRASMAIDTRPETGSRTMPICRYACTVMPPGLDARFRIRAGTDDLLCVW